ncbi:hypothetical protein O6R05_01890 [Peptoniphilus equinus]|uniref:Bacterial PH domain-containing protein n=1 Tax=Peptoniphilus equinus TaxID=3016343 RepID=A0ABY7QU60_9FIRM|nr:hypothetical protein [Peptoniphilus equinus]WBW50317.1 hypothetical protein O6R05_01890 [Peptoniphilus equinus]
MSNLPWTNVNGAKYLSSGKTEHSEWSVRGGWMMAVVLIAAGLFTPYRFTSIFGILFVLALLMKKIVAVTERGLEIFHEMYITTSYELWPWDVIDALTYEPDPKNGDKVLLYFTKDVRTKKLSFPKAYRDPIVQMAKRQNKSIKIYDGVKERQLMKG